MHDLLGQARRQRLGVEVLELVEHQPQASAVQAQQRVVQLAVLRQQLLEVGLAHAQQRRLAVGVGIVGAWQAVEQRDVAEPDAGLAIGERDLLARQRDQRHPHRAARHAAPFLGGRPARGQGAPVAETTHIGTGQDGVAQWLR
jgi:hypothetical protein